jgi:lysophospholipase L1-like esterase
MADVDDLPLSRKVAFSAAGLLLLLVAICILAALGELVMRAIGPQSDGQKIAVRYPDSPRRYGLAPNARALQTGVLVQTNSLGFREREYPLERAPGKRRIVVIGDSYTFGLGVEFEQTYGKVLEARLGRELGPVEVITFGVSGYNTVQELATLREHAAAFRPELIIVGFVPNDVERVDPASHAPTTGQALGLHNEMKRHSLLYRWLAPQAGAVFGLFGARYAFGATNYLISAYDEDSAGWRDAREALLGIAGEARRLEAGLLVVVFPMMVSFQAYPLQHAHDAVTRFCREHGIAVLDVLPRFHGEDAAELAVFLDGHPNARAHQIFAEAIHASLTASGAAPAAPGGVSWSSSGR